MATQPNDLDASLASPSPMPHCDLQKAAKIGSQELEWKSDLWGCKPILVSKAKQGKQTADIGDCTVHHTPTPNTALTMAQKDIAKMFVIGKRSLTAQNMVSEAAPVPPISTGFQIEPIFAKQAQRFADLERENSSQPRQGWGFGQTVSSTSPTNRYVRSPKQGKPHPAASNKIPAVELLKFENLPSEVKIMIWDCALPTFVEVIFNEDTRQFFAPGPREAILDLCRGFTNIFHMKPIHLSCENAEQSNLDVILIRPAIDTVYIGCEAMLHLDVKAFCGHPGNQVIENLALSAVSCGNIRWCGTEYGRNLGTRSLIGDLVRGLKNLKKLFVVEGDRLHRESEVDHWSKGKARRYEIKLSDVPATTHLSRYDHRGKYHYWPPAKPWIHPLALKVIQMYEEEVEREKSGDYPIVFSGTWSRPEMIPKLLSRTLLCWDRQPPLQNTANKMQFLPRPLPATQFFRNPIKLSNFHDFESARHTPDRDSSNDAPNKTPIFQNRSSFLD